MTERDIDILLEQLIGIIETGYADIVLDCEILNGTIYRWDNAKHEAWKKVSTYPHHFHEGEDRQVSESLLPHNPIKDIKYILKYMRDILR